ncbi:MAG: AMP-binding protein [Solirubrobacteraceae bacterium]
MPTPTATSIPALIVHQAAARPSAKAVIDASARLSFAEFADAMHDVARGLIHLGIRPGDRVALWAPNSVAWLNAYAGILAAGAVVVPINTRFKGAEAAYILERADARAVFTVAEFHGNAYVDELRRTAPELRVPIVLLPGSTPADGAFAWEAFVDGGRNVPEDIARARQEQITPNSPAYVLFTSGTTGRPKGAEITHGQSLRLASTLVEHLGLTQRDRVLAVIPLFHIFGMTLGFLLPSMTGAGTVLGGAFHPTAFMDTIERERIAIAPGPPTIFQSMLDAPDRSEFDLSTLRMGFVSAADLPAGLIRRMIDERLVQSVITAYGLTEALLVSCSAPGDELTRVAEYSGRVLGGVELRAITPDGEPAAPGEPGELLVRSPMVTTGYLGDPAATQAAFDANGWFRTGDIGIVTEDGWVRITGRSKDIFIVGGFNAYPAEIEEMLREHEDIEDAAVVGMPDHRMGEVGAAFVVLRPGASADPAGIIAWSRERMANFKVPRHVEILDALPLNATMKVTKVPLRARAEQIAETVGERVHA